MQNRVATLRQSTASCLLFLPMVTDTGAGRVAETRPTGRKPSKKE